MERPTAACSGSTPKGITRVEGRGGSKAAGAQAEVEVWSPHTLVTPAVSPRHHPCCALLKAADGGQSSEGSDTDAIISLLRSSSRNAISLTPLGYWRFPPSRVLVRRDEKKDTVNEETIAKILIS